MNTNLVKSLLLLCIVVCAASSAISAPPYPFHGLLERSHTVFVGSIHQVTKDGGKLHLSFQVDEILRGKKESIPDRIAITKGDEQSLDRDWWADTQYVVISQGDAHFGEALPHIEFHQRIEGQAGWRGWIAFRVVAGEKDKEPTLKHTRQRVNHKLQGLTISQARELVKQGIHKDEKRKIRN